VQADTVKNQVWAWMTANGLSYRKIDVRGEFIESGFKQPDAYNLIASFIPIAVDKIVTAHDWILSVTWRLLRRWWVRTNIP